MDAYSKDCRTTYKAYHHGGTRLLREVRLIVMHSTESSGTAKDVAHYFSTVQAGGSAHLVVDDTSCYRCLPNTVVPWGAPGANTDGFHIEQVGYADWAAERWMQHQDMLKRGAYKAAIHCKLFKIPATFVTAAGLKAGKSGITTHAEVSKAFPNDAGNHHDPGTGWPAQYFVKLVRAYLEPDA